MAYPDGDYLVLLVHNLLLLREGTHVGLTAPMFDRDQRLGSQFAYSSFIPRSFLSGRLLEKIQDTRALHIGQPGWVTNPLGLRPDTLL